MHWHLLWEVDTAYWGEFFVVQVPVPRECVCNIVQFSGKPSAASFYFCIHEQMSVVVGGVCIDRGLKGYFADFAEVCFFASILCLLHCWSSTGCSLYITGGWQAGQTRGWWWPWGTQVSCWLLKIGDQLGYDSTIHSLNHCIPLPLAMLDTNLSDMFCWGRRMRVSSCQFPCVLLLELIALIPSPSCKCCWLW